MKTNSVSVPTLSVRKGFTLIELLVVITIVAILVAIMFPVLKGVALKGKMAKEVAAGRSLITGYLAAAVDQDGQLLGGYDRSITEVTLPDGSTQGSPISNRYPFRLLPYLGNKVDGTILINDAAKTIAPSNTYMVSCYPTFGINYIFVGGDIMANGNMNNQAECISRQGAGEVSPLVFASAAGDSENGKIPGYCLLTPPQTTGAMWTSAKWTTKSYASEYGNLDPRYNKKAVCVFLDGSVQQLSVEDLRDMRLWSRNAALTNRPNYTIAPSAPTGGR